MRAVWLRSFGPPSVLEAGDAPEPVAGPGQVVIDVHHANITFVETQFRATGKGPFAGTPLPMVPGNGVGGYVVPAGGATPSGGPRPRGRRVIASTGGSGGYAERVAVDEAALYDVPDGMALDDAVALLADGRTATMLARAAGIAAGERVLVLAAAGGVGTLLIQLAHGAGALVVGAVGSDRKLPLVRSLGATEAVRYEALEGAFDVVFDGVGGDIARSAFAAAAPRRADAQLRPRKRVLGGRDAGGGRRARRRARPARPLPGRAARGHPERPLGHAEARDRPALPARARRRRPRRDRGASDGRQDRSF